MCDICVMNRVKHRMLSRRDVFRAGAASAAAATLGGVATAPAALARGAPGVTDMTHTLSEEFPTFGGSPGIAYDKRFEFVADGYNLHSLTVNEHTGTHLDALPAAGATLLFGAPKVKGGTGGPARILAMV